MSAEGAYYWVYSEVPFALSKKAEFVGRGEWDAWVPLGRVSVGIVKYLAGLIGTGARSVVDSARITFLSGRVIAIDYPGTGEFDVIEVLYLLRGPKKKIRDFASLAIIFLAFALFLPALFGLVAYGMPFVPAVLSALVFLVVGTALVLWRYLGWKGLYVSEVLVVGRSDIVEEFVDFVARYAGSPKNLGELPEEIVDSIDRLSEKVGLNEFIDEWLEERLAKTSS